MKIKNFNIENYTNSFISNLSLVKNGDKGYFGKVYRLNDEECLKIFNDYNNEKFFGFNVEDLLEKTKYRFNTVVMPKKAVFVDEKYAGYIVDYIDGIALSECLDYDFSAVLVMYNNLIEKVVEEVSEAGFIMEDVNFSNIMVDPKTKDLRIIDTDFWKISKKHRVGTIKEINKNTLNKYFFRSIRSSYYVIEKLQCSDFISFFETMKKNIETSNNVKIKTLGDVIRYGCR